MNVLIISAHPDDETIGMGSTIFKLKDQGHQLSWLVVTRAFTPKWPKAIVLEKLEEVQKVSKFYGFLQTHHAKFKAASLTSYPQHQIVDEIAKIVAKVEPEIVYTPPLLDTHQDHEMVAKATLLACRPQTTKTVNKIFSYEIAVSTAVAKLTDRVLGYNYFVDISQYLAEKLKAMSFYRTEIQKLPHSRSKGGLKILARERGLAAGFEYAEAFALLFAREN